MIFKHSSLANASKDAVERFRQRWTELTSVENQLISNDRPGDNLSLFQRLVIDAACGHWLHWSNANYELRKKRRLEECEQQAKTDCTPTKAPLPEELTVTSHHPPQMELEAVFRARQRALSEQFQVQVSDAASDEDLRDRGLL